MSRHVGFVHTFSREGVNQAAYGSRGGVEAALLLQAGFQSGQGALGGVGAAVGSVALARQAEAQARNEEVLRQALPQDRPAKTRAHVIALVSAKGGVGKSAFTVLVASYLHYLK